MAIIPGTNIDDLVNHPKDSIVRPENRMACAIHGLDVAIQHLQYNRKIILNPVYYEPYDHAILSLENLKKRMQSNDTSRTDK